jgi:hypothetical protein
MLQTWLSTVRSEMNRRADLPVDQTVRDQPRDDRLPVRQRRRAAERTDRGHECRAVEGWRGAPGASPSWRPEFDTP